MRHAYGSAEEVPALLVALGSTDAVERDSALTRFYIAVHDEGCVYACTTASLPFLFELTIDTTTPNCAAVIELLVSIGTASVENCDTDYADDVDFVGAVAVMREHAEMFVAFAADPDAQVRRAAIPGLARFIDDGPRAAGLLRDRLLAELGITERLLIMEAMATLALRIPTVAVEAMAWFDALATDACADPETRLGALAQQARCAPEQIGPDFVPAATGLLRRIADAAAPLHDSSGPNAPAVPTNNISLRTADWHNGVHAPTAQLLDSIHQALGSRTAERTELLTEQLRSPDPRIRLDAIRMARPLMASWRGDHSTLIVLVADQLGAADLQVAAEAAAVLDTCHAIAEPARETLAEHVAAQRTAHGPDVWAAADPALRRAHQSAVCALARLGDIRAVPSLLAALDGEVDTWRAIEVAGDLPQAADELTPQLCEYLRRGDLAAHRFEACATLSALAALGDPAALPTIIETLTASVHHEQQWVITRSALAALTAFGTAAVPALATIRTLTTASDDQVRVAAVTALWAVGRDREEMLPLLVQQLDGPDSFRITEAADVLTQLGPAATAAAPRLRELMAADYEWIRVHCAAALWEIGGHSEASTVLDTLLQAWADNAATANHVVACLERMGPAAISALPQLRTELAMNRRSGWSASIDNDESLQRVSRAIITQLAG
ncbi:hypothetical protein [Nocardia sp. NPDC051463]|uniref:hypothetical protein n=1 Tax=Nocardia sp. NPDC051463 TaxID=3154845 RepID=UPI0034322D6F